MISPSFSLKRTEVIGQTRTNIAIPQAVGRAPDETLWIGEIIDCKKEDCRFISKVL
jgi:hypothetical protein